MARKSIDELEVFLLAQDVPTLAGVLLELSHEHDAVRHRLERLRLADRPSRLAASFRKRLNAWRRSTAFVPYAEAGAFGRELELWLAQIERELLPKDPAAASSWRRPSSSRMVCSWSGPTIPTARSARHWARVACCG